MNLKKQVGLIFDMYTANSKKMYYAEVDGICYFGRYNGLLSESVFTEPEALALLKSDDIFEFEDISEKVIKDFEGLDNETEYSLEDFKTFSGNDKFKKVAIGRKALSITDFDFICKLFKDDHVTIKHCPVENIFLFYVEGKIKLIRGYQLLETQTKLITE